jgi:hypothetical protein
VIAGLAERRELARLRAEGAVPDGYGRRELDRLVRAVSAFSDWADLLHSIDENGYVPTVRPEDYKRRKLRRALVAAKLPLYPPACGADRSDHEIALAVVCRLGVKVAPPDSLTDRDAEIAFVGRVLTEEGCRPEVFRLLDEKPGTSSWGGYEGLHGEWHYRLRRFRNGAPRPLFNAAAGFGQ